MKSRTAACVWCFFLGGIGAHKFYLGQTGMGLLYLCFCWTGIPPVVAFIEFFLMAFTSEDSFNQKYNFTAMMMGRQSAGATQNVTIQMDRQALGVPQQTKSAAEQIAQLSDLHTKGAISDEEFHNLKQKALTQERTQV